MSTKQMIQLVLVKIYKLCSKYDNCYNITFYET